MRMISIAKLTVGMTLSGVTAAFFKQKLPQFSLDLTDGVFPNNY